MTGRVTFVTPSFGRDLVLCTELCQSIERWAPDAAHHILVDGRDIPAFDRLRSTQTTIVAKEDILPRGFVRLPVGNRWVCPWTPLPLNGWVVQQIAKLAGAAVAPGEHVIVVDSDTALVAPLDEDRLFPDGTGRLYRLDGGVTAALPHHITWHENACRMLGLATMAPPMPDYISSFVTWEREIVVALLAAVSKASGRPWYEVVARTRQFSEFFLYGVFVEHRRGLDGLWVDGDDRCLTYWDDTPIDHEAVDGFVAGVGETDLAVLISSHSRTSARVRSEIRRRLEGNRPLAH